MSWSPPIGMYRPGTTLVHRAPVGVKLAALALLGLVLVVRPGWRTSLVALAVVLALAIVARLSWRDVRAGLVPVAVVVVVLGLFQVTQRGWEVAVQVSAGLFALVLAGLVLTATTPTDRMVDLLLRGAAPLRHVGLRPEVFALSVALMLRTIPALGEIFGEARDAARARGLERSPRAVLVPTALRTVARAHAVGDALAARGLGE